jgi:RHS repeat-associated protein
MRRPRHAADPTPPVTTNVYDGSGRVTSQTDELNRTTTLDYTSIAGATKVTDPKGNVTVIGYEDGVRTFITRGWGTPVAATWNFETDSYTLGVTKVTDPNGAVTRAVYDRNGNVLSATDALGHTVSAAYNELDQPVAVTDAVGVTTTAAYDTAGNLTSVSTPLGGTNPARTVTMHYDPAKPGDVTSVVDPENKTWSYTYDTYGNRISTQDPLGRTSKAGYDAATGWLLRVVSPRGVASGLNASCTPPALGCSAFTHNKVGQMLTATDALGNVTERHYDADGQVDYTKDAKAQQTNLAYDDAGQLTTVTRPGGSVLRAEYWPDGSVKLTKDGAAQATYYGYDAQGRATTVTDPNGRTTTYGYDLAGRVTSKADHGAPCPACTTYGYDAADRLTSITYSDPGTPDVTAITYDGNGRRLSMTDGTGTSSYVWDSLGRLRSSNNAGQAVAYDYNLRGQATTTTYPGDKTVTRTYDDAGNPKTVSDWLGHTTTYDTNADGQLASATTPVTGGSQVDTWGYDNAGQPTSAAFKKGNTTLGSMGFTPDAEGLLSSQTDTSLPAATAQSHSYGYTALDQLASADGKTLAYDAADNLTKLANGATQGFDPANQLCFQSWSGATGGTCAAPPAGAHVPTYDNRGNRTGMGAAGLPGMALGWDQANRLRSVTPTAASGNQGEFTGVVPQRILDTRATWRTGTCVGTCATLGPGATLTFKVAGMGGVPTGAAAAVVSVTTQNPTAGSYVTLYASNDQNPGVPTVGWNAGQTASNTAIVKIGADGYAKVTNLAGNVDVLIAVEGWYSASSGGSGSGFSPTVPTGVFDTRAATRTTNCPPPNSCMPIPANGSIRVKVAGVGGIPASGVDAVAMNLTVVNPSNGGSLTMWPTGGTLTGSISMLYQANLWSSKLVVSKVSSSGEVSIHNFGTVAVDVFGDVQGWFATGSTSQFQTLNSPRVASTHPAIRTGVCPDGCQTIPAGGTLQVHVTGQGGVPASGVSAVMANVHALGSVNGALTVYPSDVPRPLALSGTFTAGNWTNSSVMAKLAPDGTFSVWNNSTAALDVIVDIQGYYLEPTPAVTYTYDGDGLRMTKAVGGATKNFVWDRSGALPMLIHDGTYHFVYGPDGTPLSQIDASGNVTYLHHDRIGTTRQLTNTAGAVVGTSTYDPYGNLLFRTGSVASPLGFAGEYTDAETGFVYLRARYYDPTTAQFLNRDPLESLTGEPYGYVGGNPLNAVDPTGMILQELAGTAWDLWDVYQTFSDPCASSGAKWASVAFLAAGIVLPGSGKMYDEALGLGDDVAPRATRGADFVVDSRGTAIPTDPGRLRAGLERSGGFQDVSTNPSTSRKFVGTDHGDPIRIRIEKGHPADPTYTGPSDPLHGVDHLHVERRANGATGPWREQWKIPYSWPF